MTPEGALAAIAEMAITIAGFTGLIMSIRPRQASTWGRDEIARIIGIVVACLVTALCSLLPFSIAGMNVEPHLVWAIPLLLSGGVSATHIALIIWQNITGNFYFIMKWVTYPMLIVMAISSVVSILSGLGLFLPYSGGVLVFQLIWVLFISAVSLAASIAVILRRHAGDP